MSAATADRLLRGPRTQGLRGLATTRAGTLLKQQISMRTFEQWNEKEPGFLEADVVAHCGSQPKGHFLSTLTLTDIATGWTECFPLLTKSAEAVVSALQQARTCFPFPILGLDTDNGCEFINECLLAYYEAEHITFTRGRPDVKNDQCFVEQKNGAVVRQVIGYDRFEGEQAYQQLREVYQALHLYINGFQPSMKLQAKQYDGKKVRRIYDAAKTPLQRLLLSHVLSASQKQELQHAAQVLDPLRLFHHLQDLQRAMIGFRTCISSAAESTFSVVVLPFCIERCIGKLGHTSLKTGAGTRQKQLLRQMPPVLFPPVSRSKMQRIVLMLFFKKRPVPLWLPLPSSGGKQASMSLSQSLRSKRGVVLRQRRTMAPPRRETGSAMNQLLSTTVLSRINRPMHPPPTGRSREPSRMVVLQKL
jgi:hypothetical protein